MRACLYVALVCAAFASGCSNARNLWVKLGDREYSIEVADDDKERQHGLMFRESMEEDHGMLFIHDTQMPLAYWMKNTKIPLDILYFDNDRKLVSQQRDVPPCSLGDGCPPYPSNAPARYVLELNAGQAEKIGLKEGDVLTFGPGVPTEPAK